MENKYQLVGASWCANCKPTKAKLDSLGVEYEYVDADSLEGSDIVMLCGVRSLPTLLKDGVIDTVGQSAILAKFQ